MKYIVTFTSAVIEADNADEAIDRAGEFKGGGHWEAIEVERQTVEQDPHSGRWYELDAHGERLHGPYLDRPAA